jgi:hypothetical protein
MRLAIPVVLLSIFATCAAQPGIAATLGWDITLNSSSYTASLVGTPRANGVQFTLDTATNVDALGMWDQGSRVLQDPHNVQLWTDSGTLLASTMIDNSAFSTPSTDTAGQWLFADIAPLLLSAGTYRIAVGYSVTGDDPGDGGVTVTSIGATVVGQAYTASGAGATAFPAFTNPNSFFGPNLLVASPTPEPSTLALLGAAFLLVGFCRATNLR